MSRNRIVVQVTTGVNQSLVYYACPLSVPGLQIPRSFLVSFSDPFIISILDCSSAPPYFLALRTCFTLISDDSDRFCIVVVNLCLSGQPRLLRARIFVQKRAFWKHADSHISMLFSTRVFLLTSPSHAILHSENSIPTYSFFCLTFRAFSRFKSLTRQRYMALEKIKGLTQNPKSGSGLTKSVPFLNTILLSC